MTSNIEILNSNSNSIVGTSFFRNLRKNKLKYVNLDSLRLAQELVPVSVVSQFTIINYELTINCITIIKLQIVLWAYLMPLLIKEVWGTKKDWL